MTATDGETQPRRHRLASHHNSRHRQYTPAPEQAAEATGANHTGNTAMPRNQIAQARPTPSRHQTTRAGKSTSSANIAAHTRESCRSAYLHVLAILADLAGVRITE
jgi:hypothetical protein